MRGTAIRRAALAAYAALFYAFLYLPILLLVVLSVNDSQVIGLPFRGFTWRWFVRAVLLVLLLLLAVTGGFATYAVLMLPPVDPYHTTRLAGEFRARDARGLDFGIGRRDPVGGAHVAFDCPDRETVDRFHANGLAAGGRDNGAPGIRAHYDEHYYAAYVLDPDGNNVEAVCHHAPT